jgi:hypothetical protein
VSGSEGQPPRPLLLEDSEADLPMAVSLQDRQPRVGRAGLALCREYPHLVCLDFLAHVGAARTWTGGRHRLSAAQAVSLVMERLRPALAQMRAMVLALPAYLSPMQASQVVSLAHKAKLPVAGSVGAPLALARTAFAEQPWSGLALLVSVDDHALTWTTLEAGPEQFEVADSKALLPLSLRDWKDCLVDAIAACCIRHSRRDPRDSGAAEQLLYDQLDDVLEADGQDQTVEVIIRTATWCQNLFLQPQQIRTFCAPLAAEAAEEIRAALAPAQPESLAVILLTTAAARLPGLQAALQEAASDRVPVRRLAPDAAALAAFHLAGRFRRGELPNFHADVCLPLPAVNRPLPRLAVDH